MDYELYLLAINKTHIIRCKPIISAFTLGSHVTHERLDLLFIPYTFIHIYFYNINIGLNHIYFNINSFKRLWCKATNSVVIYAFMVISAKTWIGIHLSKRPAVHLNQMRIKNSFVHVLSRKTDWPAHDTIPPPTQGLRMRWNNNLKVTFRMRRNYHLKQLPEWYETT